MRQQIERFLRQFSADAGRLDALKFNAGRWLTFSRRTTPGIMLVGKVESAEPVGKLYEVKLAIGVETDAPVVTVLAADDPALLPGDQAFVLGSVVDDPAAGIAGYEGSEPTAVWSGMALKLNASP